MDRVQEPSNSEWTAMFGATREEATGDCRKLHSEDLHNLRTQSLVIKG
jgi:hypothetical protein